MTVAFEYGQVHPCQADLHSARRAAKARMAKFYLKALTDANALYRQGKEGVASGLAKLDANLNSIRMQWRKAVQSFACDMDAAKLCRDYAEAGATILPLRFPLPEQVEFFTAALAACRVLGDRLGEGTALENLGCAFQFSCEYEKAIACHQQKLDIALAANSNIEIAGSLINLANAHYGQGNYSAAIQNYKLSLACSRDIGFPAGEINSFTGLGNVYFHLGKYRAALLCHQKSLAAAKRSGNLPAEGMSCTNLGNVHHLLGDYEDAITRIEQGLAIARQLGDRRAEGTALQNLGITHELLGNHDVALRCHSGHLEIARDFQDRLAMSQATVNLGATRLMLHDFAEAIACFENSLDLARELEDHRGEGSACGNLGLAYEAQGDACRALNFFGQHLAIARECQDQLGEGIASYNIACNLFRAGQKEAAIRHAEYAAATFEAIRSPNADAVRKSLADWKQGGHSGFLKRILWRLWPGVTKSQS